MSNTLDTWQMPEQLTLNHFDINYKTYNYMNSHYRGGGRNGEKGDLNRKKKKKKRQKGRGKGNQGAPVVSYYKRKWK